MKNILQSITLLTLIGLASETIAQSQQLSLIQAQDFALKNAFQVKSAQYDKTSADYTSDELLGIGLPQLNGSVQYQNFINLPTSIIPGDFFGAPGQDVKVQFGVPHQMTVGLTASQLLFDGTWLVGLEASKAYAELQRKNIQKSEVDIRAKTADAYSAVLTAQANLVVLRDLLTSMQSLLNDTEAMQREGFSEQQDVDQLMLSVNELMIQISYTEQYVKITKDLLKFTIGMPLSTEVELTDTWESLTETAGEDVLSFNPSNSIDVQLAENGLLMQQLNVKSKKAALMPNLAAFYNLQTQGLRDEFDYFDTSLPWFPIQLWGIQLNVPILSGGSKSKTIKKTEVEVQRMTDMVSMTKEAVQLEFNTATTELSFSKKRMTQAKANLELAKSILQKEETKYREGLSNSFNITQRNQQVIDAQRAYITAAIAYMNAQTKLNKVLNK
ncbi:MAG: TolC family protein [Flavobacteriales bacterium]